MVAASLGRSVAQLDQLGPKVGTAQHSKWLCCKNSTMNVVICTGII